MWTILTIIAIYLLIGVVNSFRIKGAVRFVAGIKEGDGKLKSFAKLAISVMFLSAIWVYQVVAQIYTHQRYKKAKRLSEEAKALLVGNEYKSSPEFVAKMIELNNYMSKLRNK